MYISKFRAVALAVALVLLFSSFLAGFYAGMALYSPTDEMSEGDELVTLEHVTEESEQTSTSTSESAAELSVPPLDEQIVIVDNRRFLLASTPFTDEGSTPDVRKWSVTLALADGTQKPLLSGVLTNECFVFWRDNAFLFSHTRRYVLFRQFPHNCNKAEPVNLRLIDTESGEEVLPEIMKLESLSAISWTADDEKLALAFAYNDMLGEGTNAVYVATSPFNSVSEIARGEFPSSSGVLFGDLNYLDQNTVTFNTRLYASDREERLYHYTVDLLTGNVSKEEYWHTP